MTSDSTSSASTTPMVLTPDSTGGGSPDSSLAAKKARRTTAFYPNLNSSNKPLKPFSRSAAKRESVMALGSIEHLQHYFTKTGIAAKKNPLDKPHHGLVPAIGGRSHIPTSPSLGGISEFELHLPPSPAIPTPPRPAYPPFVKTYETDPESLLPGVVDDLVAVARAWRADEPVDAGSGAPGKDGFDVLGVLKTTTHAIRSIRNYLLSLPDESAGTIRAQFRPNILGPGNKAASSSAVSKAAAAASGSAHKPDPLTLIRKSALEVLTVLRELEESCRLPLSDDAYDAHSDGGGSKSPESTQNMLELPVDSDHGALSDTSSVGDAGDVSMNFSLVQVGGRYESVPVWEDEDASDVDMEEEKEKRERWDERLVLGSGWLYRQDVSLRELGRERGVVLLYLDVVDEVLFGGKKEAGKRGWERERKRMRERAGRRRVSAGDVLEGRRSAMGGGDASRRVSDGMLSGVMGAMALSEEPGVMAGIGEENEEEEEEGLGNEEELDDDELPVWARRGKFDEDPLARAHSLLSSFLPPYLLPALSSPSSRIDFLASLSSGQLLCVAYNACVRKSKKPWGFVSNDGIHDILALEERAEREGDEGATSKKGWTFRRTDNLRLWAGALKLRYLLPIQTPSQHVKQDNPGTPLGSPGPTTQKFSKAFLAVPPLIFDAKVVARKDEGWEDMLEVVLLQWVQKAVDERRIVG